MTGKSETVVDFIARGECAGVWKMVLVEQGPWAGPVEPQLRRIQERLCGCLDAALDGQLAAQFPESTGAKVIIQLDCYEVPRNEVEEFFRKFSSGVLTTGDYTSALEKNKFVNGITFEVNFDVALN